MMNRFRRVRMIAVVSVGLVAIGLSIGVAVRSGSPAGASAQAPDGFVVSITPVRVFDSRLAGTPLNSSPAGSERVIDVFDSLGASPDVIAVFANVTVVGAGADGYVTVFPTGRDRPNASNVNFTRHRTVAASTLIARGSVGSTTVSVVTPSTDTTVDLIVDVFALVTSDPSRSGAAVVRTIAPGRVHDTRTTSRVGPGEWRTIPVVGRTLDGSNDLVPSDGSVTAVAINVTVVNTSGSSRATWIATSPDTSLVNVDKGRIAANFGLVPVAPDGTISIYNDAGSTDVIVDVWGYTTSNGVSSSAAGRVVVLDTPFRAIDSRPDPLGPGRSEPWNFADFNGSLASSRNGLGPVTALVGNLTGTDLRRRYPGLAVSSFLTVYPSGPVPSTSILNLLEGDTMSNLGLVRLGDDSVSIYNDDGYVNYVLDVAAVIVD